MRVKPIIVALSFAIFGASAAEAIEIRYMSIEGGVLFIGNSEVRSAPSPIIPTIGVSVPLFFEGSDFYLSPRFLLSWTDYLMSDTRPAPAEVENGEHFVLLAAFDIPFGYRLQVSEKLEIGFLAGISVLVRIPVAYAESYASETGNYVSYFYGSLRFVYPDTEICMKWNATQDIAITLSVRALWPLFHLWDGEMLPFTDQLHVAGLAGLSFRL